MAEVEPTLPKPQFGKKTRPTPPPPVKLTFTGAVGTMITCLKVITLTEDKSVRTKTKAVSSVIMWNGSKPKVIASGGAKKTPTKVPREPLVAGERTLPASAFIFSDYVMLNDPIGSDQSKIYSVTLSVKDYKNSLCKEVMILSSGFPGNLKGFVGEELYYFLDYEDGVGIKGYTFAVRKSRTASIYVSPSEPRKLTFLLGEASFFIPKMEPVTPQRMVNGLILCGYCGDQFYEGEEGTGFCPCEDIAYCSQACSTKNWKVHKKECKVGTRKTK